MLISSLSNRYGARVRAALTTSAWFLSAAGAAGQAPFPELPKSTLAIGETAALATACRRAQTIVAKDVEADSALMRCFPSGGDKWMRAEAAARGYEEAASQYYALSGVAAPEPNCAGDPASATMPPAKAQSAQAQLELQADESEAKRLEITVDEQEKSVVSARTGNSPQLQALTTQLSELKTRLDIAKNTVTAAEDRVAKSTINLALAVSVAHLALFTKRDEMDAALKDAEGVTRSPADFEQMLDAYDTATLDARTRTRLQACLDVHKRLLDALGTAKSADAARAALRVSTEERTKAHRQDLFRKAETTLSGALSGNGFAEQPGSPDKAIFSLMSALGADSKTNGTQLVMSLNLATLIVPKDEDRLKLSPSVRNLTLRANLPLDATDNVPQTGSANPTDSATATTTKDAVSRFTLVLGSSLFDDTDPRLATHDVCYAAALAYKPFSPVLDADDRDAEERHDYYDVCNRRAANEQRLSWRFGAGFITPAGATADEVKAELLAAAVVWGPTPWFYGNAFYQRILQPAKVNVFGLGWSVGGNVGGSGSGVDSWARITLDVLGIYSRTAATATGAAVNDIEFRISPTLRAKILGNSVAKIGVGPRILGRDASHPSVLATFALAYDADALIDQALTVPAVSGGGPN